MTIDKFQSKPLNTNIMDAKKVKFSPSTFQEVENATIERLIGNVDRYATPVEYRGRFQTTWDKLATAFPPHGDSTVQPYGQRWGRHRPIYDCFLPPSHTCICYKCLTLSQADVSYFHGIMEQSEMEGSSGEYKAARVPASGSVEDFGINSLVGNIQHVAHFYTNYVFVPGYAAYDEPPSTPSFTRIRFLENESQDEELRRKWVRRMRIVPTKLIF